MKLVFLLLVISISLMGCNNDSGGGGSSNSAPWLDTDYDDDAYYDDGGSDSSSDYDFIYSNSPTPGSRSSEILADISSIENQLKEYYLE